MHHFKIETPIWKNKAVGLDMRKIEAENLIEVLYLDKTGQRPFPFVYKIEGNRARTYPTMRIPHKDVRVHVIPICELEVSDIKPQ